MISESKQLRKSTSDPRVSESEDRVRKENLSITKLTSYSREKGETVVTIERKEIVANSDRI